MSGTPLDDFTGSRDLFGYRLGVKLVVRAQRDGKPTAGVYEPGSHRLFEAWGCRIHHPAINRVLRRILEEADGLGILPYDEKTGEGTLRYIVLRFSPLTRKVRTILVTAPFEARPMRALARQIGLRARDAGGIVWNVNPGRGNTILGSEFRPLRPPRETLERVGPWKIQATDGAFLQANAWTARRIYETVLEGTAPGADEIALDLYCGVGPLSLYLASRARLVFGIEASARAIADARSNARRNGIGNARFRDAPVEEALPGLRLPGPVGVVTLNPPRKGVAAPVVKRVAALRPRAVAYVSCNPETLARDLDRFAGHGYVTRRVGGFDMLPQTDHVEAVALLTPGSDR